MLRDRQAKNVLGIPVIGSNEQGAVYLHFQLLADKTASADATHEPAHHPYKRTRCRSWSSSVNSQSNGICGRHPWTCAFIRTNVQGVVHGHPQEI